MPDPRSVRDIVERVVNEAVHARASALCDEVVRRVLEELQPLLAQRSSDTEQLRLAMAAIHESSAQSDILRALVDGAALFCGRIALFVVRGGSAVGWQARGFRDNDAIKILTVDLSAGLAARVLQERCGINGPAAEFDSRFLTGFGAPSDGECLLLPLVIREKIAALLYADSGMQPGSVINSDALQLLVRAAGLWVELLALRKSAGVPTLQVAAAAAAASAAPPAAPSVVELSRPEPPVAEAPRPEPPPLAYAPAAPAAAPTPDIDDEVNRKARRFARLLVDEIRLYNQAKVTEGKQHRDLYDRLKDDIDKSRATYDKRYGQAALPDYFAQELVRGLADNDPALLGDRFPR